MGRRCWGKDSLAEPSLLVVKTDNWATGQRKRLHVAPKSVIVCSSIGVRCHSKEVLDYYYWQAVVGGKQKIKHASLSVMRSWGVLDAASAVIYYDTLHEMKQSTATPMLIDRFQAHPTPYVFPTELLSGWFHVVWPRHNTDLDTDDNTQC